MTRHLRYLDRAAKLDLVHSALGELADLGVTGVWPDVLPVLARIVELEGHAERVARPAKAPPDVLLTQRLATGDLDPDELPGLLDTARGADSAERLVKLYRAAAERCRIEAVEIVRRTGDRLVVEHLRPAAERAVAAGDAVAWVRLAGIADELRSVGLLPSQLSAVSKRFDERDYRFARPERLPANTAALGPVELLEVARQCEAGPTLVTDAEVYQRQVGATRAPRPVSSGSARVR